MAKERRRHRSPARPGPTPLRSQRGFSLMEVLAGLVLFAVGMVALAGQSMTSLRSTADGQFISQATIIAEEISEAMRANLVAYETANFASTPGAGEKACTSGNDCSAQEAAQWDSSKWLAHVAGSLPGGVAVICMDSTPNDGQPAEPACDGAGMNTVKIFWTDSRNSDVLAEGESFHRYSASIMP